VFQAEHPRRKPVNDFTKHKRVNDSLLGPLERPALKWLAANLPTWVSPDVCTVIGILGALVVMISYALSMINGNFLWFASLGFVINWFGDSLDGTIARHRHIERPIFGFFIDHTTDAFNELMIFLGLGLTPYVHFSIACLALIGYLLLSVLVYVRMCVMGEFKISSNKMGPTEFRLIAILLNTGMYFGGVHSLSLTVGIFGRLAFSVYDILVAAFALMLLYLFIENAIPDAIRLAKEGK
jgi:archaetidylinositol phosphate synthase